ncbi:hypothetical protein IWZ01DRAFT_251934 [Phyllosticta capitalensis]
MENDPMRRATARAGSSVPNAGQHGHLTNQPTKNSTAYGGTGAISAGVPGGGSPPQNPAAPLVNFADSFAEPIAATPTPGPSRFRETSTGRSTSAVRERGRGRGTSHPLSPINEHSCHGSASASPSAARRSIQRNLNGAFSVSGHDVPVPSIEGPDNTFQNETVGPQTVQSAEPREQSPAESIDSSRTGWTKLQRMGSSFVNCSWYFIALLHYAFLACIIVDMIFIARMWPPSYFNFRKGQVNVLFHSSEATHQLRVDQAGLKAESLRLDDRLTNLFREFDKLQNGYDTLRSHMPENLILPSVGENGQAIIPESFWTAARAFSQATGEDNRQGSEFWKHFMDNNAARLEAYLSTNTNSLLKKAVQKDVIVDRDTVIGMIKYRIDQLEHTMPHITQGNLTYALDQIIVANMREVLTTVNFFSLGLGAKINPDFTSPSLAALNDITIWGAKVRNLKNLWVPSHYHYAYRDAKAQALTTWQEENDCWCTPKSNSGQAQIGIKMYHTIYPTRMVVEHIPKGATLDITTAPQRIELWLEVKDVKKRKMLQEAVKEMIKSRTGQDTDKPDNKLESLKEEYVFVGSFDYDINAPNYVQSLEPLVSLAGLEIPVKNTIVRVSKNYGQEFTCLYRVRMLGQLVGEVNKRDDARFP